MQIRCPHCAATVEVDAETVGRDAPTPVAAQPSGLHGGTLACADCRDAFSVYVY